MRSLPATITRETLAAELAALNRLTGSALRTRWAEVFGRPASPDLSTALLRQSLAHRRQEQVLGGIPPAILKELHRLAGQGAARQPPTAALAVGVRLVREWQGRRHVVDVTADGLVWAGRVYPSLSAVARAITGTRWSGPRFFGLPHAPARRQRP